MMYFTPYSAEALRHRNDWITYLTSIHWDHFCTFTFRRRTHPDRAEKYMKDYIRRLHRLGRPAWAAYCIERGSKNDLIHCHALLGGTNAQSTTVLASLWKWGRPDVQVMNPALAGVAYITKSIASGQGQVEMEVPRSVRYLTAAQRPERAMIRKPQVVYILDGTNRRLAGVPSSRDPKLVMGLCAVRPGGVRGNPDSYSDLSRRVAAVNDFTVPRDTVHHVIGPSAPKGGIAG